MYILSFFHGSKNINIMLFTQTGECIQSFKNMNYKYFILYINGEIKRYCSKNDPGLLQENITVTISYNNNKL